MLRMNNDNNGYCQEDDDDDYEDDNDTYDDNYEDDNVYFQIEMDSIVDQMMSVAEMAMLKMITMTNVDDNDNDQHLEDDNENYYHFVSD